MKVFFDTNSNTVTIENVNKYFSSGTLVAVADGNNVSIKYTNNDKIEVFDNFSVFTKQDGSPAGANVTDTVNYLNGEFNKGMAKGNSSFSGLGTTKVIVDSRIAAADVVLVEPVGLVNEVLGVTVSDGSFEVSRGIANSLGVLTNNMAFKWVRM